MTLTLLIITVYLSLAAMAMNCRDWSSYARIYKTLPSKKYRRFMNVVYGYDAGQAWDSDDRLIWFLEKDSLRLKNGIYIFSNLVTFFDPVSHYWRGKYLRYLRRNVDINTLLELDIHETF